MSVLGRIFGGQQSAAPQQQAAQPNQNPQQQASGEAGGEGNNEATNPQQANANSNSENNSDSPLAEFAGMWENGEENKEGDDSLGSIINFDQQAVADAVSKINFTDSVTPEMMQQVAAGGEEAQEAFAKAMNAVAQNTFQKAMMANSTMLKQALDQSAGRIDSLVDSRLRNSQASDALNETNPIFKDKAAAPIVSAVKDQLARQYPQASAKEIADMANKYLNNFASGITAPERQQQEQQQRAGEMDWEAYLTE